MNVVLLGAPGVGKGTIAKKLSEHFKLPHISTGDILRANIRDSTPLGLKAKPFVDSGRLVPDDIVTEMVKSHLNRESISGGFFLDGYPRNVSQAKALKSFSDISNVINFTAPKKVIIERLTGRRTCRKCGAIYHLKNIPPKKDNTCDRCGSELYQRSDEAHDVIMERLSVYQEETEPVIDFYRNEELLRDVDATKNVDEIFRQCVELLK